jgi:HEAT repeat protein
MNQEEKIKSLLLTLKSSETWETKTKAVDFLLPYDDSEKIRFQDIKNVFLSDKHPQLRLKLIDLFGTCYKIEGMHFLKQQYKNCNDGTVREKIIETVGNADLDGSFPFFIEALGDANINSKKLAITFLGKTGNADALVPLIELLHLRNLEIYNKLIESIVKLGKKSNIQIISDYIKTEDPLIRREIPIVLGKIGRKESEELLITSLQDENPLVRKNSVKALEKIIGLKNVRYILEKLHDQDIDVRKEAIRVLGGLGSKRAIKPLLEFLKEKDVKLRNLVRNALYKILMKTKQSIF